MTAALADPLLAPADISPGVIREPWLRDYRVDFIKGLAIVGVVFHHVTNRRFSAEFHERWAIVIEFFAWSVFGFIFLSGYLQGLGSLRKARPSGALLLHRAQRLLLPFLWLGILYALLFQVVQSYGLVDWNASRTPPDLKGKLADLFLHLRPVGEQLYFFVLLFICSAINIIVSWQLTSARAFGGWVAIFGLLSIPAVLISTPHEMPTTGLSPPMVLLGTFQFGLGVLYGKTSDAPGWRYVLMLTLLGVLVAAILCRSVKPMQLAIPLMLMAATKSLPNRVIRWRPIIALGSASATIFAFHTPFLLQPLLIGLFKARVPELLDVAVAISLTLLCCLLLHKILWSNSYLRFFRV